MVAESSRALGTCSRIRGKLTSWVVSRLGTTEHIAWTGLSRVTRARFNTKKLKGDVKVDRLLPVSPNRQ